MYNVSAHGQIVFSLNDSFKLNKGIQFYSSDRAFSFPKKPDTMLNDLSVASFLAPDHTIIPGSRLHLGPTESASLKATLKEPKRKCCAV